MNIENRYERGLAKLREIDGEAGENVLRSLEDIAPDFARYLIEFQESRFERSVRQ